MTKTGKKSASPTVLCNGLAAPQHHKKKERGENDEKPGKAVETWEAGNVQQESQWRRRWEKKVVGGERERRESTFTIALQYRQKQRNKQGSKRIGGSDGKGAQKKSNGGRGRTLKRRKPKAVPLSSSSFFSCHTYTLTA